MATVTGLTAERMLAIEAASVVDGDVVGNDLVLTTKGGTQINAGNVRGPQGIQGPVGSDLDVVSAKLILDVGLVDQIRAGRQLTAADFTNMGLSVPVGLWNLSDLSDASGNGRSLSNKGAVPFAPGINGLANTAAQFSGSTTQALYISDTGANDPFKIKSGSWGCWSRTSKRATYQNLLGKWSNAVQARSFSLLIDPNNVVAGSVFIDGTSATGAVGTSDVADDRWHHIVMTYDGTQVNLYVDGMLEASNLVSGPLWVCNAPFNIGSVAADAATAPINTHFGRIDEVFVTSDVLSEDQIRNLYCAKIPHILGAVPSRLNLNVHRRRKGAAFAVSDFPAQPLRLYNFSGGSLGDEGSNNAPLTNNGAILVAGMNGASGNAYQFMGAQSLSATDVGAPVGIGSRSIGLWFKNPQQAGNFTLVGWGVVGSADFRMMSTTTGTVQSGNDGEILTGPFCGDGRWHFVVAVQDVSPVNGVKNKLYLDGRLVNSGLNIASITSAGAARFRVGSNQDGASGNITGTVDSVFVCDYALTFEQILSLYYKSVQTLTPSPKNVGDHVEGMTATDILAIFDTLEPQYQVDLSVAP